MASPKRTRGARVDVTPFVKIGNATKTAMMQASNDMQIEAAKAGAEKMQEFIETRGTGNDPWGYNRKNGNFIATPMRAKESPKRGNLRSGSTPGRINTGNMRDSVGFKFETGATQRLASFGWLRASGEDLEYFMAQEYGFTAGGFRKPKRVEGMFALRDARLYVVQELLPKISRKYQNRITKGKY